MPENVDALLGQIAPALKTVLWPIFAIIVVVYVIVSVVLLYHWRRYALHNKRVAFAETLYFLVSVVALVVALFALIFV